MWRGMAAMGVFRGLGMKGWNSGGCSNMLGYSDAVTIFFRKLSVNENFRSYHSI